ncbi:MAG: four helix bundle protein [Saprospiraceae bacterium]|nr:four helix bundle protein [Saprospiraceae bacterium]
MIHKDLDVWKISINLVTNIYQITKTYPKDEMYGICSQIRRSAISIPSNIAEGAARNSPKEFIRFLNISSGSLAELETQLIISKELDFINKEKLSQLEMEVTRIGKMLQGLIRSQRKKLDE